MLSSAGSSATGAGAGIDGALAPPDFNHSGSGSDTEEARAAPVPVPSPIPSEEFQSAPASTAAKASGSDLIPQIFILVIALHADAGKFPHLGSDIRCRDQGLAHQDCIHVGCCQSLRVARAGNAGLGNDYDVHRNHQT